MAPFSFTIKTQLKNGLGRTGVLKTPHGMIRTPAFVVVGTAATVKSVSPNELKEIKAQIVLANTYHLYLRPGADTIEKAGGIHSFMGWDGPIMTDSGGFQVFSLGLGGQQRGVGKIEKNVHELEAHHTEHSRLVRIDDDGVTFTSHIDGSTHRFTPEISIRLQEQIGADIIVAFDECTSPRDSKEYIKKSLERTHAWARRSLKARKRNDQMMLGVVQGGEYRDLREHSARDISSLPFDGFAIGGSFTKDDISSAVGYVNALLPEEKYRHLLGIGEPEDIFLGIENGVDAFDCVAPSRVARNGTLYTRRGNIDIKKSLYKTDFSPIEEGCECSTCKTFTRAYLNHLMRSNELLGYRLATIHNIYFIVRLIDTMRESIDDGKFEEYKKEFFSQRMR